MYKSRLENLSLDTYFESEEGTIKLNLGNIHR
jgi:hypothetical protein